MSADGAERRLAAILSADVVGYSRLMAEDESATVGTVTAYREQVEMLVPQHRGRVVDFTGDNFLSEFPTATDAVSCAVEIQSVLAARNADVAADRRMEFRIGVHLGEIRVEGDAIFGDGVNIAARLEALAEPGGLCISATVRDQVRRQSRLSFQDLGGQQLKNIPDPVQVYRVLWSDGSTPVARPAPAAPNEPSVAVLAFENMSPDPDQEFFADGMSEELINALTQVEGLRVIARTSAFSFKGQNVDIRTIGQKLNVSTVVEGSVRKAGNRLRISAQLIDVAGGHHLWSEVYDRSLDDVFEIQDEIARTIVMMIKPKLLGDAAKPLVTRSTESQEAYELYLRASDRISTFERWDTRTAVEMLKDATRIDPNYADAWGSLSRACTQMDFAFESDRDWAEQAERAIQRAFELDPDNAEALFARGRMLWSPRQGFQHTLALRSIRKARELQPGSHEPRVWQALIFLHVGLLDEAQERLREALAIEPDHALTHSFISQASLYQGRLDEAREHMDRALAADPMLWTTHCFNSIGWVHQNEFAKAEEALHAGRRILGPVPILDSTEALMWAKRGEEARAEECLARALEDRPSVGHDHHRWHHAACTYAVLGRPKEAIARLGEASHTGLPNYPAFRDDPHLTSLRDDPEMKKLVSELEQEWTAFTREFGGSLTGGI